MNIVDKIGFVETPPEIANLMVELLNNSKDALILDTGCGKGIFLEALKNHGYNNVWGIEIDNELYMLCNKKFGKDFKVILGDFLIYNFKNQKFDFIIGNPPYVHFNKIPKDVSKIVKRIIKTGEGDIYYAFIIKSIQLLKDGGELIYIVPYHFLYNTYAKIIRETLLKCGKIEIIIDLDETRLFKNENPETIIFKFKKGMFNLKNEKIKLLTIKTKKTTSFEIYEKAINCLENKKSNELFSYIEFNHYLSSDPWSTFILDIPNFPSVKLKDIAKVGVGLVSGFDNAFVLNKNKIEELNNKEIKLTKKFVKGKHCRRFILSGYMHYILINDSIKNEIELERNYPNIFQQILPYKNEMFKRYLPKNKKWFHWQALRNYKFLINNFDKKRIYVPTLDRHPYNRFSFGEENLLPSGDVLFIQTYNEEDIYFLLGYLNSTFFREYYLANGGRRGGRVSFTQRLLENVEIPLFTDFVKKKIISIVEEIIPKLKNNEDISKLEKELDDLIYCAIKKQEFKNISVNSNTKSKMTLEQWEVI